jgi:methyl-accepting chemotaxis protein
MDYFISNVLEPDEFTQFSILLSKAYSMIKPKLAVLIFVDFLIVGLISLFISHQIAGPSYKIKNSIQKIKDGNLNFKVTLRKGDKFTDLAHNLNMLIDEYRQNITEIKSNTEKIKTALQTNNDKEALNVLEKIEETVSKYNI